MDLRVAKKTLSAALASLVVLISPGLAPYSAVAGEFSAPAKGAAFGGRSVSAPALPSLPSTSLVPQAPGLGVVSAPSADASAAASGSELSLPAYGNALPARAATPTAQARAELSVRAEGVRAALPAQGVHQASSESAFGAGRRIEDVLTDDRSIQGYDDPAAAHAAPAGYSFAKPAGDSVREAAQAHQQAAPQNQPPAPPADTTYRPGGGDGNDGGGSRVPLAAKVTSALIALVPAALLGWPLLASGATVIGTLTILASLGVAATPFMTAKTPKALRALPGVLIAASGALLVVFGVAASAPALALPGIATTLGGWGLARFGFNDSKWKSMEPMEVIVTFIGALSAVAGAGTAFSLFSGTLARAGLWATSIGTLPLLMHLPGWIGNGITAAMRGVYLSVKDAYRVATSVRRDSNLYNRLTALSSAYVDQSVWNLVWLGLFVWLPVAALEAASMLIGAAFGLAHGLVRAPVMAAWGASYSWNPKSRTTQTLAYMGRWLFNFNKSKSFNNGEKILLPWANSANPLKSIPAALGIRAMQLLWLSIGTLSLAGVAVLGWPKAVVASRQAHDAKLDNPDDVGIGADELDGKAPDAPKPTKLISPVLARLLAAAIGLVPAYFVGLPLAVGGGIFGSLLALTSVAIGLMPLLPGKTKLSNRQLFGSALTASGLFTALGAARYLTMGLPVGWIAGLGVAAFFGGIGLRNLIKKVHEDVKAEKASETDHPIYALGFVGALAVITGLNAALLGLTGPVGTTLFVAGGLGGLGLSVFLPSYLWKGLWSTLRGTGYSISSVYKGLGFWHDKTQFGDNLSGYLNGLVKKWWAAGALLVAVPYLLWGGLWLAEALLSLGLGLALAAYQAPARYIWSASYHANPNSRFTRFWAGFNRAIASALEGRTAGAGKGLAAKFGKTMNAQAPSGRPTLKAFLAFVPVRLVQAVLVAGLLLELSPLWWLGRAVGLSLPAGPALLPAWALALVFGGSLLWAGIRGGIRNARGPKAAVPSYQDPDNPSYTWNDRGAK